MQPFRDVVNSERCYLADDLFVLNVSFPSEITARTGSLFGPAL